MSFLNLNSSGSSGGGTPVVYPISIANGGTGATSFNAAGIIQQFGNTFGTNMAIGTNDANNVGIKVNGSIQHNFFASGNVGIGTNTDNGYLFYSNGASYFNGASNFASTVLGLGTNTIQINAIGANANTIGYKVTNNTAATSTVNQYPAVLQLQGAGWSVANTASTNEYLRIYSSPQKYSGPPTDQPTNYLSIDTQSSLNNQWNSLIQGYVSAGNTRGQVDFFNGNVTGAGFSMFLSNGGGSYFGVNSNSFSPLILRSGSSTTFSNLQLSAASNIALTVFAGTRNINIGGGSTPTDIGAKLNVQGSIQNTSMLSSAQQTTVNGTVSGTMTASQPEQGVSWKKIVINCASLNGNASYTFPTPFTTAGNATFLPAGVTVSAISNTSVTLTGTGTSGIVIIEGY